MAEKVKVLMATIMTWCRFNSRPYPWISHFTIISSAWWLQASNKLTGKNSNYSKNLEEVTLSKCGENNIVLPAFSW